MVDNLNPFQCTKEQADSCFTDDAFSLKLLEGKWYWWAEDYTLSEPFDTEEAARLDLTAYCKSVLG